MPRNQPTNKIRGFSGLTNVVEPEELVDADRTKFPLLEAENVFLTNARKLKQRAGYTLATAGSYHSLWGNNDFGLAVKGTDLVQIDRDLTETVLRNGMAPRSPVSYDETGGRVYYMNDAGQRGYVESGATHPWGIEHLEAPTLATTGGSLAAGTYRVTVTQRLPDGQESAAWHTSSITVTGTQGILVTIPPVDAGADSVIVYAGNGQDLYKMGEYPAATGSVSIVSNVTAGRPLLDWDGTTPPQATVLMYHSGRMYLGLQSYIYFSYPYKYGMFGEENYLPYGEPVTLMASVDGGFYVSADKTYYVSGDNPKAARQDVVSDAKAVKGSLTYVERGEFPEITKRHAVWLTDRGFVLAGPGGAFRHLTEEEFTFAVAEQGAIGKVKTDGVTKLVGLMKDASDDDNNFGMADRVSAEVIRNSVT